MSDKIAVSSSRVPVTRQMLISQLDFYQSNLKWNEVILNDPPYPPYLILVIIMEI